MLNVQVYTANLHSIYTISEQKRLQDKLAQLSTFTNCLFRETREFQQVLGVILFMNAVSVMDYDCCCACDSEFLKFLKWPIIMTGVPVVTEYQQTPSFFVILAVKAFELPLI